MEVIRRRIKLSFFLLVFVFRSKRDEPEGETGISIVFFRGERAASPQLPRGSPATSDTPHLIAGPRESRQAAETCRLAACAPQG